MTDIRAAIGEGPAPPAPVTGGEPAVRPSGELADPFVNGVALPYPVDNNKVASTHYIALKSVILTKVDTVFAFIPSVFVIV